MQHIYSAIYENVMICPLEEDHIELLRMWRNNPQNAQFLNKMQYITKKMQKNWYESYLLNENEITFAIIEKTLNRMVGSISLLNFEKKRVECGHIMVGDAEAHGKHVCENALHAILKIAFVKMRMEEVYLHVFKDNVKAVHIYQKVGFKISKRTNTEHEGELMMVLYNSDFDMVL